MEYLVNKRINRFVLMIIVVLGSVTLTGAVNADQQKAKGFPEGAHCLFIGHSFFVPVAKVFDEVAQQNNFPKHNAKFVFARGNHGAPGALWESPKHRDQIEEILITGKVELLGMTVTPTTAYKDYVNWIDLALKHNPDTAFFIGICWVPHGQKMPAEQFDLATSLSSETMRPIIEKLRETYPNNAIYVINYGKTVSTMRAMFDNEQLHDITVLVDDKNKKNKQALFTDHKLGHAGPMMLELCALTWLDLLYAADPTKLSRSGYDAKAIKQITQQVDEFHKAHDAKDDHGNE